MLSVLVTMAFAVSNNAHAADVIAHRGFSCGAPDNSIESIRNAWVAGADAVELDVRVSADGVAYLFHDAEILERRVDTMSFAEVNAASARRLVRLTSLAAPPENHNYYLLDLKSNDSQSLAAIVAAVRESGIELSRFAFQGSDLFVLNAIGRELPLARRYYLSRSEWRVPYLVPASARQLAKWLRDQDIDGVSIKGRSFVGRRYIETLKKSGLAVKVWTVNNQRRIEHYRRSGADAIITDNVRQARGLPTTCPASP